MKKLHSLRLRLYGLAAAASVLLCVGVAKASPFASCITNTSGTISFYLNEGGGNVTVVNGDGTTNATFNGVGTQAAGAYSFPLVGGSYTIYCFKAGSGSASEVTWVPRVTARGLAANINPASPYFGYVYSAIGGLGIVMQNSDGSGSIGGSPMGTLTPSGVTWGATSYSPNKFTVAPDDSLIVSDFSSADASVTRCDPRLIAGSLVLSGIGQQANHGSEESQPILTGTIGTDAKLYVVDGTWSSGSFTSYNYILGYNIGSGALPWSAQPDLIGTNVNPTGLDGVTYGFYAGLSRAANGYFYVTVERQNLSNPNLQVYAADGKTLLWGSVYDPTHDYLITPPVGNTSPPSDSQLSPDGKTLAVVHIDNHLSIITLTNDASGGGIPDISTLYAWANSRGATGNGRGICWDAAGNLWVASSGLGGVQQISLGRTATAITTGNASGPTGFNLLVPDNNVSVYATNGPAVCAMANSYSYPTTAKFTFVRSGNLSSPLAVFFTLAGTQYLTNGTYTVSGATVSGSGYTATIAGGQAKVDVTITPTDTLTRPSGGVVTATVVGPGNSSYNVGSPLSANISVINVATPVLIPGAWIPTMYRAFSSDYAQFYLSRWGDTNTAITPGAYTYDGTATVVQDYTTPAAVSFAKGDVIKYVAISPRDNGSLPLRNAHRSYVGNKTAIIGIGTGTGYTPSAQTATLTILDDAYPAAPVLFSDPLTSGVDDNNNDGSGQWNITALDSQGNDADYTVNFGYDLSANNPMAQYFGVVPIAPPSGAATALRVTANKINAGSHAVVVNLYPTNVTFSGDYAVRFNMYIMQGSQMASGTGEGPLFGINHDGLETNWWYSAGGLPTPVPNWTADGVWYYVTAWAGHYGAPWLDMTEFTGVANTIPNTGWKIPAAYSYASFTGAFKTANYSSVNTSSNLVGGLPANASSFVKSFGNWADVEIKQVNNVITMSVNKTPVFSGYSNTNSLFRQGCLMLGYEVPNGENAGAEAAAYFSNLQVVSLAPVPVITGISVSSGNVMITFTSPNGSDIPSAFAVVSSGIVNGTYNSVTATITKDSGTGVFTATIAQNGPAQFYRIKHN